MIDYIKLKNYRQYRDCKINLGIGERGKNIVVIEGANGAGKTNLLNAITWCLYGNELHISKKYEGLPVINTLMLDKLGTGEKSIVEVEVQLVSNDKNRRYKIKRTMWIQKSETGDAEQITDRYQSNQQDGTKLEMFAQIGKDMGYYRDPAAAIQRLLPEKINEYFLFDGERLDDYFKEESGEIIKEAVFKISQLELLDRMVTHLSHAKNEFLSSSKGLTPEVKELQDGKIKLQESLEKMKDELDKLVDSQKVAKKHRDKLNKELRELSPGNIKKLAQERIELNTDLSQFEVNLDEERKGKSDYLIDITPSIFAYKPIAQTLQIISKQKEAGDIPPNYKKNFLEKLLEKGVCICTTIISKKDSKHRKSIEKLLQNCDEITNISGELIELSGELRNIKEQISGFDEKRINYTKKIKDLEEQIRRKNERLKKIEDEIKGCDIEDIKRKEEKLEEYNNEISKVDEKIGEKKITIDNIKLKIESLDEDLLKEIKKQDKLKELNRFCSFCDSALEIANEIKSEIMEETRKEIEKKTKKEFFDIIWKKETYKNVKIDDSYNFSVLDQSGRESIGTLSAGEREALTLSFIAGLNTVSGFDAPMVIDTPLARIDPEARENIAKTIPQYFGGTQIILLVTGSEYTSPVRKELLKNIHKEYKIDFKEFKKGCEAEVMPYGK